jgi:ParB-like chromosome segregation protein Spo0J
MPKGSYGGLRPHPLADAFPLLDGPAFDELKERIGKNGLLHPITLFEGMILDGRNRKRACQDLGIACAEKLYTGDDPAGFVWDENVARRHLNASQIAMAAQAMETLGWGSNQFRLRSSDGQEAPDGASQSETRDEIAKRTGASAKGMSRAKRVRTNGVPEVAAAVEEGKLALSTAERIVTKSPQEQAQIMALPPEQIPAAVPDSRRPVALVSVPTGFQAPGAPKIVAGPGRGSVGPKVKMARHMTLPEVTFIRGLYRDWKEHEAVIPQLDPEAVYAFADNLRKTKSDLVRLIHLIESTMSQSAEESI